MSAKGKIMSGRPLTPEQVKARFRAAGQTITEWAAARGYSRRYVYMVLNGQAKAWRGQAHEIAVALGLKHQGDEVTTAAEDRNTHARRAA